MQELQYFKPSTVGQAIELMEQYGKDAKILAGGTDLIIALKDRMVRCKYLIDIKAIEEMKNIIYSEVDGLSIGGAVPLNDIISSKVINSNYQILVDAARTLANSLLRNRATLIGNICNSSPGGDMLPACLALDARVEVASNTGKKEIPLKDFFLGVKKNALGENELVTRVIFPNINGIGRFAKKSRIKGHDLAQISVAAYLRQDGNLKFTVGAAAPIPLLIEGFPNCKKADLKEKRKEIIDIIISKVNPISDVRATREYRMSMIEHLSNQILDELGGTL